MQPDELIKVLTDGDEYALLDMRERGCYARAHPLLAINLPLSVLELQMRRYVPRLSTRVILCDDGDGDAERGAEVMQRAGYSDVRTLAGGMPACRAAGLELYRGHYVLPYAFGLHVAESYALPLIEAAELQRMIDSGEAPVVLDSRPFESFHSQSIPGATQASLADLPGLIDAVVADESTPIVVNCGAVTRGALGAQTLIEAGVANEVLMLANGVRGWDLAGLHVASGATAMASELSRPACDANARRLGQWLGVATISGEQLERWRRDDQRTLFVVDVRTPEAYRTGHLPGSISIQGSELVGLYEDHIGTMNARICLVDDNGSTATVTAGWLMRMGWPDVAVLQGGLQGHALEQGDEPNTVPEVNDCQVARIECADLSAAIARDAVLVLDLSASASYRDGHIPGAWWTLRSRLPRLLERLPGAEHYVVTSEDGRVASLAAAELASLVAVPVSRLAGGNAAWTATGGTLVSGMTRALGEMDDHLPELTLCRGDDRATVLAVQHRMVQWQSELLEKVARDPTFTFAPLPPMRAN